MTTQSNRALSQADDMRAFLRDKSERDQLVGQIVDAMTVDIDGWLNGKHFNAPSSNSLTSWVTSFGPSEVAYALRRAAVKIEQQPDDPDPDLFCKWTLGVLVRRRKLAASRAARSIAAANRSIPTAVSCPTD